MRTEKRGDIRGVMEQSREKEAQEEVNRKNNWTATWRGGVQNGNGEGPLGSFYAKT